MKDNNFLFDASVLYKLLTVYILDFTFYEIGKLFGKIIIDLNGILKELNVIKRIHIYHLLK